MNSISNHHSKATLVKKTEAGLHTEAVQKCPELSTGGHGGTRHGREWSAGTNNVMPFSSTNLLQSNPRENKFWRQKHKIKLMISKLREIQQKEVVALLWKGNTLPLSEFQMHLQKMQQSVLGLWPKRYSPSCKRRLMMRRLLYLVPQGRKLEAKTSLGVPLDKLGQQRTVNLLRPYIC